MPGSFPIHDLPDLGIEVSKIVDADYTTVAGLLLDRLGHIPSAPGEIVTLPGFTAEITQIRGRAIAQVRIRLTHAGPPAAYPAVTATVPASPADRAMAKSGSCGADGSGNGWQDIGRTAA
jgi:hypothetical protein